MKNRIYTIQVLEDKDYDALHETYPRIKKEDLKDSLGFADVKSGEAYVRKTNVALLDETTMQHELQELLAKASPHEEDGIRWKKGGVLRTILPTALGALAAPFTGGSSLIPAILGGLSGAGMNAYAAAKHPELGSPVTSGLLGGATGALGAAGAGKLVSGFGAGVKAGTAANKGILGQLGAGLKGAVTGTGTTAAGKEFSLLGPGGSPTGLIGPSTSVGLGLVSKPTSSIGNVLGQVGQLQGPVTSAQAAQGFTNLSQVGQAGIEGVGKAGGQVASKTLGQTIGGIATKPETILGGASLLGATASKTPKFEMPSTVADLRNKIMSGETISPLGQQAKSSLADILKAKPQELYPTANDAYFQAATRRTEEAYAQAQKNLDAAYNNAGMYGSGEHLAEKAKLDEQLARTKSGLASEIEQRRFELARDEQYKAIQTSLGVDRDTMDDLVGITGISAELAAQMYGANVSDVISIRQALGTLGKELLVRGISGSPDQSGVTQ